MIVEKKHPEAGGPDVTVLYIEGLIKLGESAGFFSLALSNVLKNEKSDGIIIDFTKIDYIDSTGVGELIGYIAQFARKGNIVFSGTSTRIENLLKLAKVDQAFKRFASEEEALASFGEPL